MKKAHRLRKKAKKKQHLKKVQKIQVNKHKTKAKQKNPVKKVARQKRSISEMDQFLLGAETTLLEITKRVDSMANRFESNMEGMIHTFESRWHSTLNWLLQQLENLRLADDKVGGIRETLKVKAQLAKMDARDALQNFGKRKAG